MMGAAGKKIKEGSQVGRGNNRHSFISGMKGEVEGRVEEGGFVT